MSELLDKVIELASYHAAGRREPADTWFTRMVHERIKGHRLKEAAPDLPHIHLTDEAVEVVAVCWSLSELSKFAGWHHKKNPKYPDEPLILFEGFGHPCFLVDGNNRINKWMLENDQDRHPVLIVKPRA
jgi:hypothetical protein